MTVKVGQFNPSKNYPSQYTTQELQQEGTSALTGIKSHCSNSSYSYGAEKWLKSSRLSEMVIAKI
jgi:hypothetical protein